MVAILYGIDGKVLGISAVVGNPVSVFLSFSSILNPAAIFAIFALVYLILVRSGKYLWLLLLPKK